jgi:tRNA threonylcarbamoyladenosine biosynthesis protein TsaE
VKTWSFDSPDTETTRNLALELGRTIGEDGLVIGLIGPLGAGKTVFVKGLAEGLGIEPSAVSSPTFVIAQQYPLPREETPRPDVLHHVDLYRLETESELEAMGFSDLFDPGSVLAVEWADRFPGVLGPERLEIELDGPSPGETVVGEASEGQGGAALSEREGDRSRRGRHARVRAYGPVAEAALLDWVERAERISASPGAGSQPGRGVGTGPQQRAIWLLVLALVLSGIARLDWSDPGSPCIYPEAATADSLGTLGVVCHEAGHALAAPTGVGGLLFGHPLELGDVSAVQLESLPGIGPGRARAIIEARSRAPFRSLRDLERVSGIGPKTVDHVSDWLTVAGDRVEGPDDG